MYLMSDVKSHRTSTKPWNLIVGSPTMQLATLPLEY